MNQVIELDAFTAGSHIGTVCEEAARLAQEKQAPVHFIFNDTEVLAQPGDSAQALQSRWEADYEEAARVYREHPDRIIEAAKRAEDDRKAREAHMVESAQTEAEMRDAKVPWPLTEAQLTGYIASLVNRKDHDYGSCVYAVSMAATAAFYYAAGVLGITGFQSGCADFDVLRRTRGINGPFILLKGEDALYPQYDLPNRLAEAMAKWEPWLAEQAAKNLSENGTAAHPDVIAHWKTLASRNHAPSTVKEE